MFINVNIRSTNGMCPMLKKGKFIFSVTVLCSEIMQAMLMLCNNT